MTRMLLLKIMPLSNVDSVPRAVWEELHHLSNQVTQLLLCGCPSPGTGDGPCSLSRADKKQVDIQHVRRRARLGRSMTK